MHAPSPSIAQPINSFSQLALSEHVLKALTDVGYEAPSPIQAATIPPLLEGKDLLGQAQTGTGKTAAFALPILCRINVAQNEPQALVLAPTRELAIQVAEAFQRYASHVPGFHVLPIYGGQSYTPQLQSLRRGVHVVVGTPGRVMDHIKKGTLSLASLRFIVLDEADEMLRMGFIDDVEWILQQAPEKRQVALFSATMPPPIRRIAQRHLKSPVEITIQSKTSTATNIRQRYWLVSGMHKLDALTRLLEVETFDGMLIFTRTKQATEELAEKLSARGFTAAALNGDIQQAQRERTVAKLKNGQIDIVVATDVAARGLDVERVSHVINYDVPHDSESYVHRIGRTGRAGRSGEAILFLSPRERNMLRVIERATRQPIDQMQVPSMDDVNQQRVTRFKQKIADVLAAGTADKFRFIVEQFEKEQNVPAIDIAAALVSLAQGRSPLLIERTRESIDSHPRDSRDSRDTRGPREPREDRGSSRAPRQERERDNRFADRAPQFSERAPRFNSNDHDVPRPKGKRASSDVPMESYRVEVGLEHGVKPGNIVGAIANEAGIEGSLIGRIDIRDNHSFVDLPEGMPAEILRQLKKARVAGQELRISPAKSGGNSGVISIRAREDRPREDRPRTDHIRDDRSREDRPRSDRPKSDKPKSFKAMIDKPRGPRSAPPQSANKDSESRRHK
jgi:ATP-dependent RNA helicase DeaD